MENSTLQTAADAVRPVAARLKMSILLVGKPDADTGTLRLTDSKGRHAATITISAGVPASVAEIRIGAQNLLGSVAKADLKAALGM
jgi:hypothetical protein